MKISLTERERDIQKAILDFLRLKNIFCYKNNVSGIYKPSTGSYIPSQSSGSPDIIAIIKGKYIGIEVKRPGNKMSPLQLAFKEKVENAGGIYWCFDSLDIAVNIIVSYLES